MINFNADIGEGIGNEKELMPYLHSCNIACGGHAGNAPEMEKAVKLAIQYDVQIGAHPSFEDKKNFGRQVLNVSEKTIFNGVKKQIELLHEIVQDHGASLSHVKPHGALYHEACTKQSTAKAVVEATQALELPLKLVGLPNSIFEKVTLKAGHQFIREGFADRAYHHKGTLVSRSSSNAVITNKNKAFQQVKQLINGKVLTIDGLKIDLLVETICFHGDTPQAVKLLQYCHEHIAQL